MGFAKRQEGLEAASRDILLVAHEQRKFLVIRSWELQREGDKILAGDTVFDSPLHLAAFERMEQRCELKQTDEGKFKVVGEGRDKARALVKRIPRFLISIRIGSSRGDEGGG